MKETGQAFEPRELAAFYAEAKADAVAARGEAGLIVAADTVVDLAGKALGKPSDAREAAAMLRALAGREHLVHTALRTARTSACDRARGDEHHARALRRAR